MYEVFMDSVKMGEAYWVDPNNIKRENIWHRFTHISDIQAGKFFNRQLVTKGTINEFKLEYVPNKYMMSGKDNYTLEIVNKGITVVKLFNCWEKSSTRSSTNQIIVVTNNDDTFVDSAIIMDKNKEHNDVYCFHNGVRMIIENKDILLGNYFDKDIKIRAVNTVDNDGIYHLIDTYSDRNAVQLSVNDIPNNIKYINIQANTENVFFKWRYVNDPSVS